jgi:hypothetical protein
MYLTVYPFCCIQLLSLVFVKQINIPQKTLKPTQINRNTLGILLVFTISVKKDKQKAISVNIVNKK